MEVLFGVLAVMILSVGFYAHGKGMEDIESEGLEVTES